MRINNAMVSMFYVIIKIKLGNLFFKYNAI